MISFRNVAAVLSVVTIGVGAAACTDNDESGSADGDRAAVEVESTADECTLSSTEAPSGNVVFQVHNGGDEVTEFYLLEDDETTIVGEVENIGPGLTRDLVVRAQQGSYVAACKPGMTGDGIRVTFTVTEGASAEATSEEFAELEAAAVAQYRDYVDQQADALMKETIAFAELVKANDAAGARALYAPARVYWESIEPVAESFGDLDPKLDLREADLEEGQEWTGWHRLEKDLWPPAGFTPSSAAEQAAIADQLVADTRDLVSRIDELELSVDQLGNGAKELLDEVATGKITGEEDAWSHTDLWDFHANLEGAEAAYQALRPIVVIKDKALATTLDERFEAAAEALEPYRRGEGFALYTELTPDQVNDLADAVDALGEPLSKLTSTVLL